MSKVAVVAVGGNALTRAEQRGTAQEIEANAAEMAAAISALVEADWRVVVVHGNGPQVGNLSIQQESAAEMVPPQPLYSLNAMSQGQLGSILVRAINERLGAGSAVAVLSHMLVNPADPAFAEPTKPIGPFFTAARATELAQKRGWDIVEDSGRGHRRVVPSPRPVEFLEASAVDVLLEAGKVVLAAGGGGIAVTRDASDRYGGVDVVIDKDIAAAQLGITLKVDLLLLLTGVEAVSIDFGTTGARQVNDMTIDLARKYLSEGQFPEGSMGPKVRAAIDFVGARSCTAVITTPGKLIEALESGSRVGTRITPAAVMSPA